MKARWIACVAVVAWLVPPVHDVMRAAPAEAQAQAQSPQAPTFRSGITLVPVDVRVLDAKGHPVTDLQKSDFQVFENGVRQQVSQFATDSLTPETPPPGPPVLVASGLTGPSAAPSHRRVFLIVLGRGDLQVPAKGLDGVLHFVREDLLPQDVVAIMAYNRATSFTTNHAEVADVLDRFKKSAKKIDSEVSGYFTGLRAIYGSHDIPANIQKDIDAVFGERAKGVVDTPLPDQPRVNQDVLDSFEAIRSSFGNIDADNMLDAYASANLQSMQDAGNLYTGVEYLKYLDGEKHLIFLSGTGLMLPRGDDDRNVARAASDARVAIDYVHTGGVALTGLPAFSAEARGGRGPAAGRGLPSTGPTGNIPTARELSTLSGGRLYVAQLHNASEDLDNLNQANKFWYILGYTPANPNVDGRYRNIVVRVTRPGLTLEYRRGYFARSEALPFDRQGLLVFTRVAGAAGSGTEVHDLGLAATATRTVTDGMSSVVVQIHIDPSHIAFAHANGRNTASIEVAVFCIDGRQADIGHSWQTLELNFTDERLTQVMASGIDHPVTIPAATPAQSAKVVVYDPAGDRVGSVNVKVTK